MAHAPRITRPRLTAVSPAADYCLDVHFAAWFQRHGLPEYSVFSLPGLAPLRDSAAFSGVVLENTDGKLNGLNSIFKLVLTRSLPTCLSSIERLLLTSSRFGVSEMVCLLPRLVANLVLQYVLSVPMVQGNVPYPALFNLPVWDGKLKQKMSLTFSAPRAAAW